MGACGLCGRETQCSYSNFGVECVEGTKFMMYGSTKQMYASKAIRVSELKSQIAWMEEDLSNLKEELNNLLNDD